MATPTFEITTSSPAPSTSSLASSASSSTASAHSIEPMHVAPAEQAQLPHGTGPTAQGHAAVLGAKSFLLSKVAGGQSFHSPTDHMVSPCTKKLAQSKQRHFNKGKPLSLSSSFQASTQPQQKKSSLGQSSTFGSENASPF